MENPLGENLHQPKSGIPNNRKYLIWGCISALVIVSCVCIIFIAGGAGLVSKYGGEPEGFSVDYTMPHLVEKDQEFELIITMSNTSNSDILVSDIDLDEMLGGSILDGAMVLSTNPEMKRDYSLPGVKTFIYNRTIHPGETEKVTFNIQAVTPGEYGGSIGIYVGDLAKRFDYVDLVITE